MDKLGTIHSGSRYYDLYTEGMIGRPDVGVNPSGQWLLTGAVRLNNFGHVVERKSLAQVLAGEIKTWKHKNGKQLWHLCDLDHGTPRVWMSPEHELWLS